MKAKSWLKYFVIIVSILLMVFWGEHVFGIIREQIARTFEIKPYFQSGIMFIFFGGIGFLVGLETLIEEIKKEGTWAINIPKLVLIGIPSLYFSLAMGIYYYHGGSVMANPIRILLRNNIVYIAIFQLILGYTLITSFYKKNDEK